MHVILWAFEARPETIPEFIQAYRSNGDWANLFSLAPGFRGLELLSSVDLPHRYVTIDRWDQAADYVQFQARFGPQYRSLDQLCEHLTRSETMLGMFDATE